MNYYTIYDKKAGEYGTIFAGKKTELVKRDLAWTLQHKEDAPLSRFSSDYELYWIFEMDVEKGTIRQDASFKPQFICNLDELKHSTTGEE